MKGFHIPLTSNFGSVVSWIYEKVAFPAQYFAVTVMLAW